MDRESEFTPEKFAKIVNENGTIMEFDAVGTPQQNGKAELDNRTIVDHARLILMGLSLSETFWGRDS